MAQRKNVSIRFLAEQCGVSTATVSRVLNHGGNVTEETRHKVLQAMEEYKYVTPSAPKPKVSRIGVVIVSSDSDYYHSLLGNIGIYFRERGIATVAMNTERTQNYLPTVLDTLYDSKVQGIILISCNYLPVQEHLHQKIPHVWIDCKDPPEQTEAICQVESDSYVSGKMAAHELLDRGCRRPIILTGVRASCRSAYCLKGFAEELLTGGLEMENDQIVTLPGIKSNVTESQEMLQYLVAKGYPFDSVFAMSDAWALGAYMGIRKIGRLIPDDIRLIGFEGVSDACTEVLNITCIQQNVKLLVRNASEMLIRLIAKEPIDNKHIILPTSVLPGQTL